MWRESSARWPGSGGVSISIAVAAARRRRPAALAGADDRDRAALVEAQQLRQPQLEPGGDPRRDRERRARLAALDLRQHRRADAAALGEVAQRQVHASRSALTRGPIAGAPARRGL